MIELEFEIDEQLLDDVNNVLRPFGITIESATSLFFEECAKTGTIPFEHSQELLGDMKQNPQARLVSERLIPIV